MAASSQHMNAKQWLILSLLAIVWGGSFLSNGLAVRALPPITIVAIRMGGAAVALYLFLRLRGIAMPGTGTGRAGEIWRALAVMAIFNNVLPMSLIVWGQTHISASLASILNATVPLFTVFVAHLLTQDERLTGRRLMGVLIGFAGVVVIIGPESLHGLGSGLKGQVASLTAAFSYALAVVIGRRYVRLGLRPIQMAFGQVAMASVLLVPLSLVLDRSYALPYPGTVVVVALASLALLSTAFAYLLYFRLIAEAGATNASLVTLLVPVVATAFGVFLLGDHVTMGHGVGLMLIGLGLMVLDGRLLTRLRRAPAGR